jgi:nucleotide-binding universal stress UspA family protein
MVWIRMLYRHLIVPFDGTPAALAVVRVAADLAEHLHAHLEVLTSGDLPHEESLRALKRRAVALSEADVEVWIDAQRSPAGAVVAALAHRPGALVCMATHARAGPARLVAGSVAERVLRAVDVPVLLFGPRWEAGASGRFTVDEVVVCVDGDDLADEVVALAVAWAHAFEAPCRFLHVGDDRATLDRLPELAASVPPGVRASEVIVVPGDDPVAGIVELLETRRGALAVLGTHPRTGLDRLRTAGTAMGVVARSSSRRWSHRREGRPRRRAPETEGLSCR